MKKAIRLLILLVAVAFPSIAGAQAKCPHNCSKGEMRKEMQEYKMKFLAQEMGITGEKQKRFFDAYTAFAQSQDKIFSERMTAKKRLEQKDNPTDADYAAFRNLQNSLKQKEAAADAHYRAVLDKILTPKEIYLLEEGEHKFRQKMHELKAKRRKRQANLKKK